MRHRLTHAQALQKGIISQKTCTDFNQPTTTIKQLQRELEDVTPQKTLYDGLQKRLVGEVVEWEKEGLIKNRKYRVDIYLPKSRIAIEFDGFQHHSSLAAFQSDRIRQNIFTLNHVLVLRYFTKQVLARDRLEKIINQIEQLHKAQLTRQRMD